MRFLKKKVKSQEKKDEEAMREYIKIEDDSEEQNKSIVKEVILPMRGPRKNPTSPNGNSKNIVKNYGKALCAFAASDLSIPYLQDMKKEFSFEIHDFRSYIKDKKETINSIESLRRLLVESAGDSSEVKCYKKLFQKLSIIFLKFFAVNWIYHGKLTHKIAHLKFRFKMLRRIKNPEYFTYLKTSAK